MTPALRWMIFGLVGAILSVGTIVKSASADPPPWARGHHHHDDDDDDDNDGGKHHRHGYEYDGRCRSIADRMSLDRQRIQETEATGRHRKALQWYREDLSKARSDFDRCRGGQ